MNQLNQLVKLYQLQMFHVEQFIENLCKYLIYQIPNLNKITIISSVVKYYVIICQNCKKAIISL